MGGRLALGRGLGRTDFLVQAPGQHRQWTPTQDLAVLRLVAPSSVTVTATAMLPPGTALLTLLLAAGSLGRRARGPPQPLSPISTIQPQANFDAQQFAGTWLLVGVASSCRSLQEQGHRAEATTLRVAPQGTAMAVNTFRKLCSSSMEAHQSQAASGSKLEAPGGRWMRSLGRLTTRASLSYTWSGRGGCR